ncbi:TVP38/TMEM64 family protein [Haloimpatiens massiliensis]|uniref:TVP38/TMEM64 family protein n=1 Tax=Haloimpatiens massiliensis TaxID=1658110 RepID=UPI001FA890CE|nr:TVP38/TMEM64 family protein [Haloimpatiens massiliensis]
MKVGELMKKINRNLRKFLDFLIKYKKTTVSIIFLLIFGYISYEYYKYFNILKDPVKIKKAILSYGNYSVLVFLMLQIIQVVVFFIPGEIIQIAGGYIYGTVLGGAFSILGILIGSFMVYYISRYLGRDLVQKMVSKDKFKLFHKILDASSHVKIIFLLYLIPGIPKDALAYICGIADVSFKDFIIFSTLGRIPAIFISTYFGNRIEVGEIGSIVVISIVVLIIFIISTIKGNSILKKMSKKKKIN